MAKVNLMPKYLLVTGRMAHQALERVAAELNLQGGYQVIALRRSVAALMTTEYIARELHGLTTAIHPEMVIIPGLCQGPLEPISQATGAKVIRGPADLRDLPAFLAGKRALSGQEGPHSPADPDVPPPKPKILAEIVEAPSLSLGQILERASYYRASGADLIDIGGAVDRPFPHVGRVVRALKAEGFAVSIDSHHREDILAAGQAGVDLVLSLTSDNLELAKELACPAVVIPDEAEDLSSLYRNLEKLESWGRDYVIDPILAPLTLGLSEALGRYLKVRKDFPHRPLLMGLGNVTELIDADSVGINALLVGIALELEVDYVLTTEVSHRAVGAVQEVYWARRLVHTALCQASLPKHLDYRLLTIKDPRGNSFGAAELKEMQGQVRDPNYRIFVDGEQIYVFNNRLFEHGTSAQELFSRLPVNEVSHAFYLGRELEKAELALRLKKKYVQDQPLRWGYLDSQRPSPTEIRQAGHRKLPQAHSSRQRVRYEALES